MVHPPCFRASIFSVSPAVIIRCFPLGTDEVCFYAGYLGVVSVAHGRWGVGGKVGEKVEEALEKKGEEDGKRREYKEVEREMYLEGCF